jgi:hypothetical protein
MKRFRDLIKEQSTKTDAEIVKDITDKYLN